MSGVVKCSLRACPGFICDWPCYCLAFWSLYLSIYVFEGVFEGGVAVYRCLISFLVSFLSARKSHKDNDSTVQ